MIGTLIIIWAKNIVDTWLYSNLFFFYGNAFNFISLGADVYIISLLKLFFYNVIFLSRLIQCRKMDISNWSFDMWDDKYFI